MSMPPSDAKDLKQAAEQEKEPPDPTIPVGITPFLCLWSAIEHALVTLAVEPWAVIEHALDTIRQSAPPEHEPGREALHRALLGSDYERFGTDAAIGELSPNLSTLVENVRGESLETIKDTFDLLKLAVEARIRADRETGWAESAKRETWTKHHREKLPRLRREARERIAQGGDPSHQVRVTDDLALEGGFFVSGAVRDGSLARGKPRQRQGPRVQYEETRQILFELTAGMLRLPIEQAATAVEKLLLLYVGETCDADSLRHWWFTFRPRKSS